MKLRTALTVSTVALAATLGAPSSASADKFFTGETSQKRKVDLSTGDDNVLRVVDVSWRTRRCRRSGSRLRHVTTFRPPIDVATPEGFTDAGKYTLRQKGGYRIRIAIEIAGTHALDPAAPEAENWFGTLSLKAVVRRRGKVIDRCKLPEIAWSAELAPAS